MKPTNKMVEAAEVMLDSAEIPCSVQSLLQAALDADPCVLVSELEELRDKLSVATDDCIDTNPTKAVAYWCELKELNALIEKHK